MKKKRITSLVLALAIILFVTPFAFNDTLVVKAYTVSTEKVKTPIKIILIADLHSRCFGSHQGELLNLIASQRPDLVMLAGDIFDKDSSLKKNQELIRSISSDYPCFFVTGNNEFSSGKVPIIKRFLSGCGIAVLEGDCRTITVNGDSMNICGIDDCKIGEQALEYQLENTAYNRDDSLYTILLAHHPEHIDKYLSYDFDLILSGHTHGGLFRIPMIINGIYAPDQGFFPKYSGGQYDFKESTIIVSRGLAKESNRIPRLFNPPELVVVNIRPE